MLNLFATDYGLQIKVDRGLKILGLNNIKKEDKQTVLDEITKYLFEIKAETSNKKVFDYELDYKYYYSDFKRLGIDLNKDTLSWWEFDTLLESVFLQEHSTIGQVIRYRTYEKPPKTSKTSEDKEHKFYLEKKRQYALPDKSSIEENLDKLWNYVKKAGETNE